MRVPCRRRRVFPCSASFRLVRSCCSAAARGQLVWVQVHTMAHSAFHGWGRGPTREVSTTWVGAVLRAIDLVVGEFPGRLVVWSGECPSTGVFLILFFRPAVVGSARARGGPAGVRDSHGSRRSASGRH